MGKAVANIKEDDLKKIINKIDGLISISEDLSRSTEKEVGKIKEAAKLDFKQAEEYLSSRDEETTGLSSSIDSRVMSNKKGKSSHLIFAGGPGKKVMAFIEFGTRRRTINLGGIGRVMGSDASSYAKRFKGGDNPKNFTHLDAKPYFYKNVFLGKRRLFKSVDSRIKRVIKKK